MSPKVVETFAEGDVGVEGVSSYEDAVCIEGGKNGQAQSPEDIVVRFHVRANSDSEEDIALKYQVRDAVLGCVAEDLREATSKEKALIYLGQHLREIEEVAEKTIAYAGYNYEVNAYITRDEFPIREYGNLVLPAGSYQALRIDIGKARGENFWCVLYPMMCYTIDSGAVIDDADSRKLARALTEEEFEKLFVKHNEEGAKVKVRFKILELFK